MEKTAFILTPRDLEDFNSKIKLLQDTLPEVDFEIVGVFGGAPAESAWVQIYAEGVKVAYVDTEGMENELVIKRNIGRQLISKGVKQIVFFQGDDLPQGFQEKYLQPFKLEKTIGITGVLTNNMSEQTRDEIMYKFLEPGWLLLLEEDFKARCYIPNTNQIRCVDNGLMATSVVVFDKVGGYNVNSDFPLEEYQCRVQCLGYEILPLQM